MHELTNGFFFDAAANYALAVDTFYVLRGFMEGYAWFTIAKDQEGRNLKSPRYWASYYIGRYLV